MMPKERYFDYSWVVDPALRVCRVNRMGNFVTCARLWVRYPSHLCGLDRLSRLLSASPHALAHTSSMRRRHASSNPMAGVWIGQTLLKCLSLLIKQPPYQEITDIYSVSRDYLVVCQLSCTVCSYASRYTELFPPTRRKTTKLVSEANYLMKLGVPALWRMEKRSLQYV